jgi:hypothetical protein
MKLKKERQTDLGLHRVQFIDRLTVTTVVLGVSKTSWSIAVWVRKRYVFMG